MRRVSSNIYEGTPVGEGDSLVKTDVHGRKCRERTGLDTLVVYTVNSECCNLEI